MATEITYIALTAQDRLNLAREALRNRELEHFRVTVGNPNAPSIPPEHRASMEDEVKRLQKLVKDLEKEVEV